MMQKEKMTTSLLADLKDIPILFKPSARRKTLSIKVVAGNVIVAYPTYVHQREVYAWVNEKAGWILAHLKASPSPIIENPYTANNSIWWRGEYRQLDTGFCQDLGLNRGFYEQSLDQQKVQLLASCLEYAKRFFPPRVEHFQERLGFDVSRLKLRPYKSRWGSCDSKGCVALNSLLAMAPDSVVDYVVVHELCHLQHPNHSPQFWAEVGRTFSPLAVKSAKQWLSDNGSELLRIYR